MTHYKLIKNKDTHGFDYGITVLTKDSHTVEYPNISDRKNELEQLVNLCNNLEVEHCHFEEILDDFLTNFSI